MPSKNMISIDLYLAPSMRLDHSSIHRLHPEFPKRNTVIYEEWNS